MRGRRKIVSVIGACALVAGGLLALTSTPGGALTPITVATNADAGPGSLRQAFLDAQAGTDDFEVTIPASVGNITLTTGSLTYAGGVGGTHSLTLRGGGNTITQTTPNDRVMNIPGGTTFTVDNLTITGGVAPAGQDGGGIRSSGGSSVVVTNSTITGNSAPLAGGGILTGGNLTLTNSTVSGNTAITSEGGGLYVTGTATITASTISGNTADTSAGMRVGGEITLTNSTVTGNTATAGDAGGIGAGAGTTLVYSTVAGNTGAFGGANIDGQGGSPDIHPLTSFGSVVALPLGGGPNCIDLGSTTSQGYNWEDSNTCGFGAGPGDMPNAGDPGLGALGNNGGPTQTRVPQAGSGLIDTIPASSPCGGVNITVDQRGLPRPTTAGQFCDIGAVEVQVTALLLAPDFTG